MAIFLDGAEITGSAQITEAGFNFTPAADLSDGGHQLTARAFDKAGNASVLQTLFLTDASGPAISNMRPATGNVVNNSRQFFSAAVTDAVTEVAPESIILKLDGMTVAHSFDPDTGLVTFTPNLVLSEDEHQYELSARDTLEPIRKSPVAATRDFPGRLYSARTSGRSSAGRRSLDFPFPRPQVAFFLI